MTVAVDRAHVRLAELVAALSLGVGLGRRDLPIVARHNRLRGTLAGPGRAWSLTLVRR